MNKMESNFSNLKMMTNMEDLDFFLSQMEAQEIKPNLGANVIHQPDYIYKPDYFSSNTSYQNFGPVQNSDNPAGYPRDSINGTQSSMAFPANHSSPNSLTSMQISYEPQMDPRFMDPYKNPGPFGSYTDPTSPESVLSPSLSSVGSDQLIQFPMQYPYQLDEWIEDPPKSEIMKEEKCKVCGEVAGKHSAYGGKVCPSCRAFFRRSVQTKYFEIFACAKGEKCIITIATRKSCKYCRFKKCLAANMQVSGVLSDQERDRRFNKLKKITFRNGFVANSIGEKSPWNQPLQHIPVPQPFSRFIVPELHFTTEEFHRLEAIRDMFGKRAKSKYANFFSCEQDCFQHLAQVSFFGGQVNHTLWKKFTEASGQFAQETILEMDAMKELTMNDCHSLIRSNGLVSFSLVEAIFINEEDSELCLSIRNAVFSRTHQEINNLIDIMKSLGMEDHTPVIKYDQIYISPWASSREDENQHRYLIAKMKDWVRGLQKPLQPLDANIIYLMKFVITFSTDFVRLERQELGEKFHRHYSMMLFRYLKSRFGAEAEERFNEAMDICASARKAADILRRRLPI